jgi:histone H3/H4
MAKFVRKTGFELLAKRALYYAQEAGRAQVTIADVERAYTRNFSRNMTPIVEPEGKTTPVREGCLV